MNQTGSKSITDSTRTSRPSQVNTYDQSLEKGIAELSAVVDELTNRLSPVLRSEPQPGGEENCKDGNMLVPMAESMRIKCTQIERIRNNVSRVIDLLEL